MASRAEIPVGSRDLGHNTDSQSTSSTEYENGQYATDHQKLRG